MVGAAVSLLAPDAAAAAAAASSCEPADGFDAILAGRNLATLFDRHGAMRKDEVGGSRRITMSAQSSYFNVVELCETGKVRRNVMVHHDAPRRERVR